MNDDDSPDWTEEGMQLANDIFKLCAPYHKNTRMILTTMAVVIGRHTAYYQLNSEEVANVLGRIAKAHELNALDFAKRKKEEQCQ